MIERLLEHFPAEDLDGLVGELVKDGVALCCHNYGNFVVQRVLEHGTAAQRHSIAALLLLDAPKYAQHNVASNVLRAALVNCSLFDRRALGDALTSDSGTARSLERHRVASFVMREVKTLRRAVGLSHSTQEVSL